MKGHDNVYKDSVSSQGSENLKQGHELERGNIVVVDNTFRIVGVDRATLEGWGGDNGEDIIGMNCFKILFGTDKSCEWCNLESCLETGRPQHVRTRVPDGSNKMNAYEVYNYPYSEVDTAVCHVLCVDPHHELTTETVSDSQIKKLASIAAFSADAMMCVDLDGIFEFWNLGAESLFEFKRDEILGEHFHKIVPEELIDEAERMRSEAINAGNIRFETLRMRKDGTKIPVDMTFTAILDDDGKTVGIAGSVKDLTERKRLEEDYKNLFENAKDGISFTDLEGNFLIFNSRFQEMTGYSREELKKMDLSSIIYRRDRSRVLKIDSQRLAGEYVPTVYEFRLFRKDGKIINVEVTASPMIRDGAIIGTQGILRDITERGKLESEVREAKNHLETIFDTIQEGICVIDKNLSIISFNEAFAKDAIISRDEILGSKCYEALHEYTLEEFQKNCASRCIVIKALEEGKPFESPHRHEAGGEIVYHESKAFPNKNQQGETYQVVHIINDVTEKKSAEEALKKYAVDLEHSNKLKDLFSDIMRHDLLNPLGVIKNVYEILGDEIKGGETERLLPLVNKNIDKIEDLVHSAARFGQLESLEELDFDLCDLGEILESSVEMLNEIAAKKNIKILTPGGKYPAEVNMFIEDVFSNLISNAIKYGPKNTEVSVSIEDEGLNWAVKVSDNGPGVPEEHKKGIFERFKRVEKGSVKGSGLGLAIVKKVVELHQGDVWVEDAPSGGSVFIFTVPKKRKVDA